MDAWLHIVHPRPGGIDASRRIRGERGRCAIYRKIFMGLAVGPRAHVPISHNRRVTNVLLIASSRTETSAGKNRGSESVQGERQAGRRRGRGRREGKAGNANNPSSLT